MKRISHPNYIPTEQDILRVPSKTLGVEETIFDFDGVIFR